MSSLTHESGSRTGYRLRVYTAAGRKSIWLGPIEQREAVAVQRHVDEIIASQTADLPIPRATQQWLDRCDASLRAKLQPITGAARTVSMAIDEYLHARHEQWAHATADSVARSLGILSDGVGKLKLEAASVDALESIHAAIESAPSTRGKIAKDWRAFFAWCVDNRWITDDPARHLSTTVAVRAKQFISADVVHRLLDACNDPELSLVITLSRWGGLRIASEIRQLDWSDIDLDAGRMTVHDAKRGGQRVIPLFPELRTALEAQPEGPLLPTLREMSHAGITRRFETLLASCNVQPWPALWHSMRATRETELIELYGVATAAHWIGNSTAVAMRSYAMVPDSAWASAAGR